MVKELTVMESIKRPNTINFEPFFGYHQEPILDFLPPNVTMARTIQKCIDTWIEDLRSRVLYPKLGSKTISKKTAMELRSVFPEHEQASDIGITPIDLERVYHKDGVAIQGPCEMRQKWYCSNLQPRTYYAMGGTAFHTSKYLAKPMVDLCDTLPTTNKHSRVDPGRIVIRDQTNDVIYYDLTSFTSNLHTHCEFIMRLGKYCEGVTVEILDAHHGIITRDLSSLLYEYAESNLHNPTYTLPSKYDDPSVEHYHSVAGFLGVYGNIASATFIHGIVMTMLHDHLDENNIAGDDGLDVTSDANRSLRVVGTLGTVKDDKTFRESEGCCIHLKRPITSVGTRLMHGTLLTWPSLEPCMSISDYRYPYLSDLTDREKKNALAGSITAFLRSLESMSLSDDELELVDRHLVYIYGTYGLPRGGCVPQATHENSAFVPAYEKRYIGLDPIHNTIVRNYSNIARLPLRRREEWNPGLLDYDSFECNSTKLMSYLEALGYVESEKLVCYVFGYEGLQRLLDEYMNPEPRVYRYTVVNSLPRWVKDLIV
jgi:hypothetical protein